MNKKIHSVFKSLSGESSTSGVPTLFIRFQGCNLNCSYCDTPKAHDPNGTCSTMNVLKVIEDELSKEENKYLDNLILTGGSPMLQLSKKDLVQIHEVCQQFTYMNIQIETNGSIELPFDVPNSISYVIDYKLPGSGMESYMKEHNFKFGNIRYQDEVKFVVISKEDINRAFEIIEKYDLGNSVQYIWFSPCFGKIDYKTVFEAVRDCKFSNVRMQTQLHKLVYGIVSYEV